MQTEVILPQDLPPFDEAAGCPKCGRSAMGVTFHCGIADGFPCWVTGVRIVKGEHLCRICDQCGHGWCEATVETKPARRPGLRVVGTNDRSADQPPARGDLSGQ
jgi:hypothetical protein